MSAYNVNDMGYIIPSESLNHLHIENLFHFGTEQDGVDLSWDGSNTLNIDPINANDTIRIGETIQADFQVDGATDLLWDASAGKLTNASMTYLCIQIGRAHV